MPKSINTKSYTAVRGMLDLIAVICNLDCDNHCEECLWCVMNSSEERECLKEIADGASRSIQIDAEECNCNA
jgi:hypothetical protein